MDLKKVLQRADFQSVSQFIFTGLQHEEVELISLEKRIEKIEKETLNEMKKIFFTHKEIQWKDLDVVEEEKIFYNFNVLLHELEICFFELGMKSGVNFIKEI